MSFAAPVSPEAAALIADIDRKEANDQRVVVSRKEAMVMLGLKQTKLLELEDAGILRSFLDGASRRISAASIYGRLRALAVASHPLDAEPAKVRRPKHMRRRRASTGASKPTFSWTQPWPPSCFTRWTATATPTLKPTATVRTVCSR
jgi:hypothetical protein